MANPDPDRKHILYLNLREMECLARAAGITVEAKNPSGYLAETDAVIARKALSELDKKIEELYE